MIILPAKIRWSIIIAALLVMIVSAMVSANIVKKDDALITNLKKEITYSDNLIQSLWQNILAVENKAHLLVLYTLLTHTQSDPDIHYLNKYYKEFSTPNAKEPLSLKMLPDFLRTVDENKQQIIDRINNIFIEKQELEEEIITRSRKNTMIFNIALFLQLLSLAIITIVRDLK